MPYSTALQVLAICDTNIPVGDITEIIEEVDAWLDSKLPTGTMNAFILRALSRTGSAIRCYLKDPNARELGDYSEDREASLLKLNKFFDELMRDAGGGIGLKYSYERLPYGD